MIKYAWCYWHHPDDAFEVNALALTPFSQKHVHIVANEDGSSTNTGPITLKGGTGPFTELSGHGVDNGTATADGIGVGEISGVLKLG